MGKIDRLCAHVNSDHWIKSFHNVNNRPAQKFSDKYKNSVNNIVMAFTSCEKNFFLLHKGENI